MTEPPPPPSPFASLHDPNPLATPLGIGDVLDGAFRLYRAHFGPMVLTAAVVLAPLGILFAAALGPMQSDEFGMFRALLDRGPAFNPAALDDSPWPVLAVCLLTPLQFLVVYTARLALVQHAVDALRQRRRALGARLGLALRRLPGYTAMGCLMWLTIGAVVGGVALAGAIVFSVGLGGMAVLGNDTATALATIFAVGSLLALGLALILVGAYLVGRWVTALPLLVLETPDPIAALATSWQRTARRPWHTLGFVVLLALLNAALLAILTTPLYFVALVAPPAVATALGYILQALGAVVQILVLPVWACAVVLFHFDLRLRAEGPG